jgi:hypothetical protein
VARQATLNLAELFTLWAYGMVSMLAETVRRLGFETGLGVGPRLGVENTGSSSSGVSSSPSAVTDADGSFCERVAAFGALPRGVSVNQQQIVYSARGRTRERRTCFTSV